MRIFMSIQHPDSVGKVRKILLFETVFHDLVSDCTKLTLGFASFRSMIVGDDGPNGRPPTPACPINSRQSASRMNWLGARYASLLRLPACIGNREADTAGPVTSGPCVLFGKEEDTVGDIAAPGDGAQRGGAVETTVDAAAAVATQRPRLSTGVPLAVGIDKYPGLAHRRACCRKTQPTRGGSP